MKFSDVEAAAIIYAFPLPRECSGLTPPLLISWLPGHFLLDSSQSGLKWCSQHTRMTVPHLNLNLSVAPQPPWFKRESLGLDFRAPLEPPTGPGFLSAQPTPPILLSSLCAFAWAASSVWIPSPHPHPHLYLWVCLGTSLQQKLSPDVPPLEGRFPLGPGAEQGSRGHRGRESKMVGFRESGKDHPSSPSSFGSNQDTQQ